MYTDTRIFLSKSEEKSSNFELDIGIGVDFPGFFLSDRGIMVAQALVFCRAIEKEFPHLDNQLVFTSEYSELVRFKFGVSDAELAERMTFQTDNIDYQLMLDMDLIDESDIPKERRP